MSRYGQNERRGGGGPRRRRGRAEVSTSTSCGSVKATAHVEGGAVGVTVDLWRTGTAWARLGDDDDDGVAG